MAQDLGVDLKEIVLSGGPFGPQEIKQITSAIAEDFSQYRVLREAVSELELREDRSPAASVRLGVCYFLLGRYAAAITALKAGDGGALVHFYLAKTYYALGQYNDAIASYAAAAKAGYNNDECVLGRAEAQRNAGDPTAALHSLDSLSGAVEQTAEYCISAGRRSRRWAATPTKWWRCSNARSKPTPTIPARCSAWPARTTAAVMMKSPWISTNARPRSFRRSWARC